MLDPYVILFPILVAFDEQGHLTWVSLWGRPAVGEWWKWGRAVAAYPRHEQDYLTIEGITLSEGHRLEGPSHQGSTDVERWAMERAPGGRSAHAEPSRGWRWCQRQ